MYSIFFDLETTDKNPIGQIINYAFLLIDSRYEVVGELTGLIKLSRLQLPSPGAMLANRTDAVRHQEIAVDTEKEAMRRIVDFIERAVREQGSEKLPIIGYNSARFDVPYLRTSLIRNGLSPYFNGKIIHRDLLHAARKLAMTRPEFPRTVPQKKRREGDEERISYALEHLCQQFKLLEGPQLHESREDVLLTIKLAQIFHERFGLDARRFEAFEGFQRGADRAKGTVIWSAYPNYSPAVPEPFTSAPMVLLDSDHRSSLWIDLQRFIAGEGRRSIQWYNHSGGSALYHAGDRALPPELAAHKEAALKEFAAVTLKNFFSASNCDIEQDIYRLDFDSIDALHDAIWKGDERRLQQLKNRDAKVVYLRHRLVQASAEEMRGDKLREQLRQYALHRYGGRMKISKPRVEESFQEGVYSDSFHPTYNEMSSELNALMNGASGEDRTILESLRRFYDGSEIEELAGEDLRKIIRIKVQSAE